jgi:hypothetical protein
MPTPKKLSETMISAMAAISAAGGIAHPEIGGWWRSAPAPDGERLTVPNVSNPGEKTSLVTQTIYSLRDRGLLEKVDGTGNRVHQAYRLTEASRQYLTTGKKQS